MIIECPKCGFEQPKVEYCANCGVNMSAYKPKPAPLKERLLKNSYFYLALIFLVLIGTGVFVKENWFPSEKRVYTFVPTSYQSEELVSKSKANTPTTDSHTEEPQNTRAVASATEQTKAAEVAPKLDVYILSIPISSLSVLVGQEIRMEDLRRMRVLDSREPLGLQELRQIGGTNILYNVNYIVQAFQDPLLIHQTIYDSHSQDDIGFILSTAIDSYKNNQLVFTLNLKQNFYVDKDVHTDEQDQRLEIGERESRIVTGVLPLKPLHPREKALLQSGYLGIMNSPDFQSGENTFVVVLTYKY